MSAAQYETLALYIDGQWLTGANRGGVVGVISFAGSNPETPFGGVKDSGYGREGGVEGVRAYMTCKFVVEGTL
jgi:acyl-CoA reductase-like NAD-dependent aldehyde dehydrogenase